MQNQAGVKTGMQGAQRRGSKRHHGQGNGVDQHYLVRPLISSELFPAAKPEKGEETGKINFHFIICNPISLRYSNI